MNTKKTIEVDWLVGDTVWVVICSYKKLVSVKTSIRSVASYGSYNMYRVLHDYKDVERPSSQIYSCELLANGMADAMNQRINCPEFIKGLT